VVADAFHLIRLSMTALDEGVRRRRQQQIHGHRGHKHDPLFRLRRVPRVGQERLEESKRHKIFDRLRTADTADVVAAAWIAVDLLRRMYQAPDRAPLPAPGRLYEWAVTVDVAEIPGSHPRSPPGSTWSSRSSTPEPPTAPPSPRLSGARI
jgi:hypothetical protein